MNLLPRPVSAPFLRMLALTCLLAVALPAAAQLADAPDAVPDAIDATNPASRPILLVNGFCGDPFSFSAILPAMFAQLPSTLYPNQTVYYVQYNAAANSSTFFLADANGNLFPIATSSVPANARYFSIWFYDPVGQDTDLANVAKISVVNKAYELSQAIKQITSITAQKKVLLMGHSMGGLVSRAYIEGLASVGACYNYTANTPDYAAGTCQPGANGAGYGGDVGDLITVDTPHAGSPLAGLSFGAGGSSAFACIADNSTNKSELELTGNGGPGLIEALNYKTGAKVGGVAAQTNTVPIQAMKTWFSDVLISWDLLIGNSDDIVTKGSQSITGNLPKAHSTATLADFSTTYKSSDAGVNATPACFENLLLFSVPVLHYMECLGAQPASQNAIIGQVKLHDR